MLADPALDELVRRLEKGHTDPRLTWAEQARPDQRIPKGDWRIVYYQGGRGSGKTRSGAGGLADWVLADTDGEGEYAIIAPTYQDAWTVCVEGEAGILNALGTNMAQIKDHNSRYVKSAYRTYGQITLHNGILIQVDSADDGALRVQGHNLKGAWCDEIGLWKRWQLAWDESLAYAVRKGVSKIIATGTPKVSRPAAALIRRLIRNEPGVVIRRLRTVDNLANLSDAFYQSVVARASGTRLERQELEGELLDDVENALWTRELLERIQVEAFPNGQAITPGQLVNCYCGVDPSDGDESSDEQAYTIMGKGPGGLLYVVENWGGRIGPVPFLEKAVIAACRWNATLVVEKNHGGEYLMSTLKQVIKELIRRKVIDRAPAYRKIHASQAKRTRAEPVAGLYERYGGGLVHHVGPFVDLEDQMATFTGMPGEKSPDRLDSLVWAASNYLNHSFDEGQMLAAVHQWSAREQMSRITTTPAARYAQRLAGVRRGLYDHEQQRRDIWDIDSFAPQDDDQAMAGSGSNVFGWR